MARRIGNLSIAVALLFARFVTAQTMATVGYGDMAPASPSARGFAVVQAVLGQFYLAVVIADLVGKRVAQAAAAKGR